MKRLRYMYNTKYAKIVVETLQEFLTFGKTKETEHKYKDIFAEKQSCFVTLKTADGKLRGCIGTIKPRYKNLGIEIIKNAVSAATRDTRFKPIDLKELEDLKISVEVLEPPQEIEHNELPDPQKYGLIIEEALSGRRGVLLPGIEGVNTSEEQVSIIKRKAGILQNGLEGLKVYKFKTTKYN